MPYRNRIKKEYNNERNKKNTLKIVKGKVKVQGGGE